MRLYEPRNEESPEGFLGGWVVKIRLLMQTRMGLIPEPGGSHMCQGQLSPCTTTVEHVL